MVCLETSFLIDLLDDEIPEGVLEKVDESQEVTVSAVAAAEVWVGAHYEGDTAVETAHELLDSLVWLDVSRTVAYRAGKLQAELKYEGEPVGFIDCIIAATAMESGERLVTRDSDYERFPQLETLIYEL